MTTNFLFLAFFISIYILGNSSLAFAVNAPSFHFFPPTTHRNLSTSSPHTNSNNLTSSSGFAITNNSKLQFEPWGGANNLTIEPKANNSFQEFKFSGVTGKNSSGFISQDLNYSGKQVTISLKNISKSSAGLNDKDIQIFFTFTITAKSGHTTLLTYVVGPVHTSGWINGHLYQGITPGSEANINLEGLTPQDVHYLKKIVINVQRESRINNAEFGIKLA